ncbi:tyrosine-type recombinase/integrase [Beggiatoa leptomitoformis]|uniref:Tyrosine-type recombinase/integrase n=1 Tax=Beggiatoa leptomitoformis TaxID=288004 RepID=A0A2N9YGX9_9GAMM|nr:tyrosine-type recombinase/integrase [Beggiatoa leptomitoformis]ALG69459.2 tyrosine-type recombinase/integrase [Beggiatoa leptomitoformis]AUI69466.1 tyrosine-type recombinase/integrase [Beggiatoa leptomitoformis]
MQLYTLDEVAQLLKVSRRTLNRLVQKGALAVVYIGRLPRIGDEELARFLACAVPLGTVTLERVLSFFLSVKADKRSAEDDQLRARTLLEGLGHQLDMVTFRSRQLRAFMSTRLTAVSASSVNRELSLLSAAINLYNAEMDMQLPNPTKGKMLREPEGRVRWLKPEEAERLIVSARLSLTPYLADFIVLALYTGARRGELLGLTWDRVDFERAFLVLEAVHTKGQKRRCIPLHPRALATLVQLHKLRLGEFVFCDKHGQKVGNLRKSFLKACERANIRNFRVHDLRHTCAAWLVMEGVALVVIRDLLGHQSVKTTEIYAHLDLASVRLGLSALDWTGQFKQDVP